jgi:hypothetical protein
MFRLGFKVKQHFVGGLLKACDVALANKDAVC